MTATSRITETHLSCRLLTAAGVGAIAVLRVEGAPAWRVIRARVKARARPLPDLPQVGRAYFGDFFDENDRIDDVILAPQARNMAEPEFVDICCHGGRRVVERIMLALQSEGAKIDTDPWVLPPQPSWREALARCADRCLARATTQRGALFLLAQRRLLPAFFEDVLARLGGPDNAGAQAGITRLIEQSGAAHRLHDPAELIWVGEPNVGKSSLVNKLTGRDSAIVHDEAGTTRDWVTVNASLSGAPVTLIDTAGFRVVCDPLETQAVELGRRRAAGADLIIEVVSADDADGSANQAGDRDRWGRTPDLRVVNKIDRVHDLKTTINPIVPVRADEVPVVRVSARTGTGLDELRVALLDLLGLESTVDWMKRPRLFDRGLRERLSALRTADEMTRESVCAAIVEAARAG